MNVKNLDNEDKKLLGRIEHIALNITTTSDNIKHICENAMAFESAAVCVPPCYVEYAKSFFERAKVGICAVIGYPYGYATTATKIFECHDAVKNGATELEFYANIGYIKKRRYDQLQKELLQIRKVCKKQILKLIVDTAVLTHDEQIAVCTIATSVGFNYLTVCSDREFNFLLDDVARLKNSIGERARVKACGNVSSLEQVKMLIEAGASRVGESNMFIYASEAPAQNKLEDGAAKADKTEKRSCCIVEKSPDEKENNRQEECMALPLSEGSNIPDVTIEALEEDICGCGETCADRECELISDEKIESNYTDKTRCTEVENCEVYGAETDGLVGSYSEVKDEGLSDEINIFEDESVLK